MDRYRPNLVCILVILTVLTGCGSGHKSSPTGIEENLPEQIDGMVLVPAGEFIMGSPPGRGYPDEYPQRVVYVNAFYIDKYEVTNRQFKEFIDSTGYVTDAEKEGWGWVGKSIGDSIEWKKVEGACWKAPEGPGSDISDRMDCPVVQVSWNDAVAYCHWKGKRLPSETEWEKAARGTEGRIWPWGNTWAPKRCNSREAGLFTPVSVGSYPEGSSPYGVMDMAGNVWEWCANRYGGANWPWPEDQAVRGGSCFSTEQHVRAANRDFNPPERRYNHLGFRCAKDP
ncbi:MAG: formylglycine-generating enzyme family protein [Candidatus Latescibacteria bacterium]|nr:formylglycine-generating enzyme family protein [Candidatus Latescibacterota bacterium]